MSSNCPPQLQLSIQPNTTSFKRSFEQFGFDLGSPVDGGGGSSSDGNDRNKRARSESTFSDGTDSTESSSQSSTLPSASSASATSPRLPDDMPFSRTSQPSSLGGPPRLPTLAIEDIDMPDYPTEERHHAPSSHVQQAYRLSSHSLSSLGSPSSSAVRSGTPPPVLPPLAISEEISTSSAAPFLPTPPQASTPLDGIFGGQGSSSSSSSPSPLVSSADDSEMQSFRARLASALERLTPQSPLVPGLDLDEQDEQQSHSRIDNGIDHDPEVQELTATDVPAEPPTLPPIPSVVASAEIDHFDIQDLLAEEASLHSFSSALLEASSSSSTSSSISPTLDSHPLPSPLLRDLHPWMDDPPTLTASDSAFSRLWQSHPIHTSSPMESAARSRPASREVVDSFFAPHAGNTSYNDREMPASRAGAGSSSDHPTSSRPLQDVGLWERRSLELWNNSDHSNIRPPTPPPRPSSPEPRPGGRLRSLSRPRSRPASSISLVTETSLEARRRVDHDHVMRDLYGPRQTNDGMDVEMLDPSHTESARENVRSWYRPSGQDPERPHAPPYLLHLSQLPTPRLDVAPDTRDQISHHHLDATSTTLWHSSARPGGDEPRGGHDGVRPRESAGSSLAPGFSSSNPVPSNYSLSSSHYQSQSQPSNRLSPLRMNYLTTASGLEWRREGSPNQAYDDRHHSHWARPFIPDHESPPSLPPPDFGHAFETDGTNDRDLVVRALALWRRRHDSYHPPPPPPPPLSFPSVPQPSHESSEDRYRTRVVRSDRHSRLRPLQLHSITRDLSSSPDIHQSSDRHSRLRPLQLHSATRDLSPSPDVHQVPSSYRTVPHESRAEEPRYPWVQATRHAPRSFPPQPAEERRPASTRVFTSRGNPTLSEDLPPYRDSSPVRNTYRAEPPTIRFHTASLGDLERQQESSSTTYSSSTLDPSEFAPGPFRNTINQSFNNRNRPTPPTIPPLPFEDGGGPPSHYFTEFASSPPTQVAEAPRRSPPNEAAFAANRSFEQRAFRPPPPPPPPATTQYSQPPNNHVDLATTTVQQRLALHRHLSQRVRMEPSRLDASDGPRPLADAGQSNHRHPLPPPPPVDPIRHDGNNATRHLQLIELHRQEFERRRRNLTRVEGALDDSNNNNVERATRVGAGPPRRFGGVDLENLQQNFRARRRLRLPPNFHSGHSRMGHSGDFMHDDDFDDSYENLINLAATLGEVKSKSTPRDVIDRLPKGKYKDWKTEDDDKRCPICLDDYTDFDTLLKLTNCAHWFHQGCLQQWLHTANTCPVCRNPVQDPSAASSSSPRRSRRFTFWRGVPPPAVNGEPGSSARPGSGNTTAHERFSNAFPGPHHLHHR